MSEKKMFTFPEIIEDESGQKYKVLDWHFNIKFIDGKTMAVLDEMWADIEMVQK